MKRKIITMLLSISMTCTVLISSGSVARAADDAAADTGATETDAAEDENSSDAEELTLEELKESFALKVTVWPSGMLCPWLTMRQP